MKTYTDYENIKTRIAYATDKIKAYVKADSVVNSLMRDYISIVERELIINIKSELKKESEYHV